MVDIKLGWMRYGGSCDRLSARRLATEVRERDTEVSNRDGGVAKADNLVVSTVSAACIDKRKIVMIGCAATIFLRTLFLHDWACETS